tara:strand:- start:835 stop:1413 length:579 start_codon:yes stop_codon:yes gene_type:complete
MIQTINNFLNKEELELSQNYWLVKENTLKNCEQCPGSKSIYSDTLSETFLKTKQSLIENAIGEKLLPTYSFSRMYYQGGSLAKHSDRPACEISITLNILADKDWKIWFHELDENNKIDSNKQPTFLITKPGDGAVYEGCAYEHWREPYEGNKCMQVFLHYVRANGRFKAFAMDGRKFFGQSKGQAINNIWNR